MGESMILRKGGAATEIVTKTELVGLNTNWIAPKAINSSFSIRIFGGGGGGGYGAPGGDGVVSLSAAWGGGGGGYGPAGKGGTSGGDYTKYGAGAAWNLGGGGGSSGVCIVQYTVKELIY